MWFRFYFLCVSSCPKFDQFSRWRLAGIPLASKFCRKRYKVTAPSPQRLCSSSFTTTKNIERASEHVFRVVASIKTNDLSL